MKVKIIFFGSSKNSAIVKQALLKAGYKLVNQPDKADLVISADYGNKPAGSDPAGLTGRLRPVKSSLSLNIQLRLWQNRSSLDNPD